MGDSRVVPTSKAAKRRLRFLWRAMFVLLAAHFLLVYLAPEYVFLPEKARTRGGSALGLGAGPLAGEFPSAESRVTEKGGRRYLWGGPNPDDRFDISTFRLRPRNLHHGLGREVFPALLEPTFAPVGNTAFLADQSRVLAVKIGDEVKVYPVDLLMRHEVVNDVVGKRPIFAAYCVLADLGAVYDRRVGEHTLTFAVSGYTYADPKVWDGADAFVLWDRDTESLWWPPIGKAVSGPLVDTPMKLLEQDLWSQTVWGEVRARYPNGKVLMPGQEFQPPTSWRKTQVTTPSTQRSTVPASAIAPRWGDNAEL